MIAGRLTAGRLATAVGVAALLLAAAVLIALFVGLSRDAGGVHLHLLDPRVALDAKIFHLTRLPRAAAAAVSGAGLAAAGVAFQAVLRNPLAEPYTLGVSSGGALGAVLSIRFGLDAVLGGSTVAVAAFAGSLGVVAVIWRLARVGRSRPPATLLLAGVTLAFLCSAATMFLQYTASFAEGFRIVHWLLGGLEWVEMRDLGVASGVVAIGLLALLGVARDLNALSAGEDAAASVGVPVARVVGTAFIGASLMVAAVVAVAGPIGFVGLIVPHAVRSLVGPDHRVLLPASILGGAAFVLLADTAARLVLWPNEVPVGVLTALIGGPFFLYLLMREKRRARVWIG